MQGVLIKYTRSERTLFFHKILFLIGKKLELERIFGKCLEYNFLLLLVILA